MSTYYNWKPANTKRLRAALSRAHRDITRERIDRMPHMTPEELAEIKEKLAEVGLAPDERTEAEVEADAAKITGVKRDS